MQYAVKYSSFGSDFFLVSTVKDFKSLTAAVLGDSPSSGRFSRITSG